MPFACEICILAGGLSRRMGRDKTRLRIGTRNMLSHVRTAALATGLPTRVIRRDTVPRCGPIGGIYTALQDPRATAILFLAADMPFVSPQMIHFLFKRFERSNRPLFFRVQPSGPPGFPFVLPIGSLEGVRRQIERNEFSLAALAKVLRAGIVPLPRSLKGELVNVNEPGDLIAARSAWRNR